MSFKLKNRPRIKEKHIPTPELFELYGNISAFDLAEQQRNIENWFEGFEKRQRQNLADYQKALKTKKNWDKEFLACWKAISNYIKLEVLGVEPKIKEETKFGGD